MDYTDNSDNIQVPTVNLPDHFNIPDELKLYNQWLNWDWQVRDGKLAKVGYTVPNSTFTNAYRQCLDDDTKDLGVGFLLSDADPFVVIDLYDCFEDNGIPKIWAYDCLESIESYTEYIDTHSLRLFAIGNPSENIEGEQISIRTKDLFVSITGSRYSDITAVHERRVQIDSFIESFFGISWTKRVEQAGPETPTTLSCVLNDCLSYERWYDNPEESHLFPFLAKCWIYPQLRTRIHNAMSDLYWTKPHKADFIECIKACMLPHPKGESVDAIRFVEDVDSDWGTKFEDGRPVIYQDPSDISSTVDQTIDALIQAQSPLWQRDGILVAVKRSKREAIHGLQDDDERARIVPVKSEYIRELATQEAHFFEPTQYRKGTQHYKPGNCRLDTIKFLEARMELPFNVLSGVVTVPTLRPDGSIITEPGYDQETGLFYATTTAFPDVLDHPTIDDAKTSLADLEEPFTDFLFAESYHKSAAIAAILTIMTRHMLDNVPLIAITSSTRGIGKGLISDCIATIATSTKPALSAYPRNDEEMEKQLLVMGLNGDAVTIFDNVVGQFGGGSIDKALTSQLVRGRILGESKMIDVKLQTTFFATGNNIKFRSDTARRVLPITLVATDQNPEERTDFDHPNLRLWVQENQPRLLVAALTILKAFILSGQPKQDLRAYGSFEAWSDLVRSALVWCGADDPCEGRKIIESESDTNFEAMETLLHAWEVAYPNGERCTLKEILAAVKHDGATFKMRDLGDALTAYDSKAKGKVTDLSVSGLSQRMPLNNGTSRIIDGLQLRSEKEPRKGTRKFWVECVEAEEPAAEDAQNSEYDDSDLHFNEEKPLFNGENDVPF